MPKTVVLCFGFGDGNFFDVDFSVLILFGVNTFVIFEAIDFVSVEVFCVLTTGSSSETIFASTFLFASIFGRLAVIVVGCFNFDGCGIFDKYCISGAVSGVVGDLEIEPEVSDVTSEDKGRVVVEHCPL